jgi:cyclic pyranopterin phosphate synthase
VYVNSETFALIVSGGMKKGDVLAAAQVAGIMGAKRCPDLVPMCHPIVITGADVSFELNEAALCIGITATVRCKGETGVEMEALTAVSVAALTIYDMCKAVQKDIRIGDVRLLAKSGGRSGNYIAPSAK